ncbi:MAG: ABC transporter ATP-binding protein [Actinobacteria bacterium]|nr:ABC transporter ATP-binding protein [Actinomycetota bacterium]
MARQKLTPGLDALLAFDKAGVRMPRRRRRKGDGRRQRLRRIAGEVKRDEVWRLRHATFSVEEGESVAIVGGRGSGREALLRLAAGTLVPDEGTVRRRLGVVPMIDVARSFVRQYTVRQNIYLVGGLLGMSPEAVTESLGEVVTFAGVESILDKYLGTTPPVIRQRLAWATAMSTNARAYAIEQVLIVGERDFRQQCWTRVDRMREDGVTFLLASDSPKQFRRFCDRAILLDEGHVVAQTTVPDAIARLRALRRADRPSPDEPDDSASGPTGDDQ